MMALSQSRSNGTQNIYNAVTNIFIKDIEIANTNYKLQIQPLSILKGALLIDKAPSQANQSQKLGLRLSILSRPVPCPPVPSRPLPHKVSTASTKSPILTKFSG